MQNRDMKRSTYQSIFSEGKRAARKSRLEGSRHARRLNPFYEGTDLHAAWFSGFMNQQEKKMKRKRNYEESMAGIIFSSTIALVLLVGSGVLAYLAAVLLGAIGGL